MNKQDRENASVLLSKMQDGSINEWLETLDVPDLEYALELLKEVVKAKEKFLNLL